MLHHCVRCLEANGIGLLSDTKTTLRDIKPLVPCMFLAHSYLIFNCSSNFTSCDMFVAEEDLALERMSSFTVCLSRLSESLLDSMTVMPDMLLIC